VNDEPIIECMHVYSQPYCHAPACIAGTTEQLRALYETIGRALWSGHAERTESTTSDGECYDVIVVPREDMAGLALPYSEPPTEGKRWEGTHPLGSLTREDYERMERVGR
jgi:hypothetical protein